VCPDVAFHTKRKIPLRVTIIGSLSILAGLIYLFPVLGKYGVSDLVILSGQTFQEGPFVLTALIIAIANFVIGIGCLYGWRPVWFYLVIISVINFLIALFVLCHTNTTQLWNLAVGAFWFAVAAYVLLMLHSKKTRKWFRL
jgi:hypothetical protein